MTNDDGKIQCLKKLLLKNNKSKRDIEQIKKLCLELGVYEMYREVIDGITIEKDYVPELKENGFLKNVSDYGMRSNVRKY